MDKGNYTSYYIKMILDEKLIIRKYQQHKSVWKAGKELGIPGQTVHRVIKKNNIPTSFKPITEIEKRLIKILYDYGFKRGDGKLDELCKKLKRNKQVICRYARKVGLTNNKRECGLLMRKEMKNRCVNMWKTKPHPKGMLGKKHTEETIKRISHTSTEQVKLWKKTGRMSEITMKGLKTRQSNGNLINKRKASWKQQWAEIGGKRFYSRSSWEIKYAEILERQKSIGAIKDWEHEPTTFWFEKVKRGCRSYTPDFLVIHINGDIEYHEVKGWMDDRSKTKINRMRIYYPKIKLIVIDAKAYRNIIKRGI